MRRFKVSIQDSKTDYTLEEFHIFSASLGNACAYACKHIASDRYAVVQDTELLDVWAIVDENGGYDESEYLHKGIDRINYAYDRLCDAISAGDDAAADDFGDLYELYLEKFAERYGISEAKLEDIATDVRLLGWERG